MIDRRRFIKAGVAAGFAGSVGFRHFINDAYGATAMPGLSDPAFQPKFVNYAPNALNPGFIFQPKSQGHFKIKLGEAIHNTGLIRPNGRQARTRIWGYGDSNDGIITWPGRTFQVKSFSTGGSAETEVIWQNTLNERKGKNHLLPIDTNLHWCYSLHGNSSRNGVDYTQFTIKENGVPIITHLHGGHSDFQFDGNPEFFYAPGGELYGPQWDFVQGGFTERFHYDNNVPAGNLWYHDHALGITRLNVYAGLAGFYFIRDEYDTGDAGNPIGLPAYPYELAYAIQDRMFTDNGALFYSAYPGDPFYDDFITGEGAVLPPELFRNGGPSALAEFFGDHMVVNGLIWPKEDVERRNYRMRLLNGTDSRFMQLQFRQVPMGSTDPADAVGDPIPFDVVGSDQGLASKARHVISLMFEPGGRYDVVMDFSRVPKGSRVIMTNLLGDSPFGGDLPGPEDVFPDRQTDRVMAFDVVKDRNNSIPDNYSRKMFDKGTGTWNYAGNKTPADRVRKVALFEGLDEFGRLQPLLGYLDEADGLFKGVAWHMPTTENPQLHSTEVWEIYNFTGDAHPVHLHLVNFEVLSRRKITFEENGTLPVIQHNGAEGVHPKVVNVQKVRGSAGKVTLGPADGYVENTPKDMVTALPAQVTRIKATFDKPGRYVWHCHILSHEDHEMMRVLHIGPGA
jgi:FtsP/CotA-like multicopper oxidase with cupredoxin domain